MTIIDTEKDLLAAEARERMQEAFMSAVQIDLTRGDFDPTAQFSRVDHVRLIEREGEVPEKAKDRALRTELFGDDAEKIKTFAERMVARRP